jgi:hypothetical protein
VRCCCVVVLLLSCILSIITLPLESLATRGLSGGVVVARRREAGRFQRAFSWWFAPVNGVLLWRVRRSGATEVLVPGQGSAKSAHWRTRFRRHAADKLCSVLVKQMYFDRVLNGYLSYGAMLLSCKLPIIVNRGEEFVYSEVFGKCRMYRRSLFLEEQFSFKYLRNSVYGFWKSSSC